MLKVLQKLFLCLRYLLTVGQTKKEKKKNFTTSHSLDISRIQISKNIVLLKRNIKNSNSVNSNSGQQQGRSLVILVGWLSAKEKHIYKFVEIWMDLGYDVLNVNTKAWQLAWPVIGCQVTASEVLKFLDEHDSYSRIIIHGFSVGAYQWAEVMVKMAQDMDRYQKVVDKIVGQIWDSCADVAEAHIGIPTAIFPKNKLLATLLSRYMLFHLKVLDNFVTRHLVTASEMFHNTPVRTPALMILSKIDPIGNIGLHQRKKAHWESTGMKVHWKIFEDSSHVGHFRKHPEEYIAQLYSFLDSLGLNQHTLVPGETENVLNKV